MHYKLIGVVLVTPEGKTMHFKKFFFLNMRISEIDDSIKTILYSARKIHVTAIEKIDNNQCILHLEMKTSDGYRFIKEEHREVTEINKDGSQCGHISNNDLDSIYI